MIKIRQTEQFARWFKNLRDRRAYAKIAARLVRIEAGNLGDVKSVGFGISEARVDHGPGYRLYFTIRGQTLIILLVGGDKASQRRDVAHAQALASVLDGSNFDDDEGGNHGPN